MKKLQWLLLLFSLWLPAQTRAIYEYKFKADSTQKDSLKTEWMYLDISKEGSKYYSKKSFDKDSIAIELVRKQIASGSKSISVSRNKSSGDVGYEVEKSYPDFKTYLITGIGNDWFRVLEDRPLDWKILPEKKKIGEFAAQKAETNFAGRKWTAWFTTEIPFQDGPYKFHGLPGLIVKAEDGTGTHIMELKAIKKMISVTENALDLKGKEVPFMKKKPLEIARKQYVKQLEQYRNDPIQGMRELMNKPNSKVSININGQIYSEPKEVLRHMEKVAREEMKANNNHIELKN